MVLVWIKGKRRAEIFFAEFFERHFNRQAFQIITLKQAANDLQVGFFFGLDFADGRAQVISGENLARSSFMFDFNDNIAHL